MSKLLALLHTIYVNMFVSNPYCIDCKEPMEYVGRVTTIESANDVLPKTASLCFRCDEDSYEVWIYKDGSYRSFYSHD